MQKPNAKNLDTQHIVRLVQRGTFSLEQIAADLDLSKRSLQRYLEKEGTRFSDLSTKAKFELAKAKLNKEGTNIADVGRMLGYNDPSSFSRAFLNWSGESPRSFRSRLMKKKQRQK